MNKNLSLSANVLVFFLFSFFSYLTHPSAETATYYVSPDGDDSASGKHDAPWASPGYGSKQLSPGDTLILKSGRYVLEEYWEDMITPVSGLPDAWITIKGEEGGQAVLVGRNNLYSAFDVSGACYLKIENLEITSDGGAWFRDGISACGGPFEHSIIRNVYIHRIDEMGINIKDVDDIVIEDCNITFCGFGAVGGPEGDEGGCRNLTIRNCCLSYSGHYYQGGSGNSPYDRPDGFGIEASAGPVTIINTVAAHNRGDGLDSKCANTLITNCIAADNRCDGIKLWGNESRIVNCTIYGTGDGDAESSPWAAVVIGQCEQQGTHFEIINTTISENPSRHAYPMYVQYDCQASMTLLMRNTIVSGGDSVVYIGDSVDFTAEHNIFYIPGSAAKVYAHGREYSGQDIENGELGPENMSRDPEFRGPGWGDAADLHLQASSPAVDAGCSKGAPEYDLDYSPRPQGAGFDIGAYEYNGSISVDVCLNKEAYTWNDLFLLSYDVTNHSSKTAEMEFYLILEYRGEYWFYPSWSPQIDSMPLEIPPQTAEYGQPLNFTWPDSENLRDSAVFWGGTVQNGTNYVDYDSENFGFY